MAVFTWPVRVYWEDTDGGGIVYYANYLRFLERARTEWLRSLGFDQSDWIRDPGVLFTVVAVEIRFLAPARLDDHLLISCEPQAEGRVSVGFRQGVYRDSLSGPLLATATVRAACVDAATLKPRRIPASIWEALPRATRTAVE
ncbi:MAG: tol-pal system-associated acyl-CoA thioesterase [Steroidobacteraceae bacterium]|nr:tol-pal system-associated acyl-CoA thioesterase [Steroidobacteraceae bacterium]MDW8257888.1 tol-pal system-associated acyl-CoA thioesterase [Gammaproteobacteria bacterium]